MKLIDNIKLFASAGILAALLFGCKKEELKPANAVAAEYSTLTFEAVGAESQDLPVYADGYWNVECDEQWVEFSTIQGYGSSTLKVYVQDNLDNNVMDLPRKAKVYLRGGSSDPKQNFYFIVEQKGDKYKGVKDITVTEAVKLEDGRVARVPDAQVLAKGTKAFIVSDGTSHLMVLGEAEVKPGDQISFNGEKGTSYGVPVVSLDELEVKASGTAVYPDAKVVDIDTYAATTSEFIQVEGSLVGSTLRFAGKEKRLDIVYPTSELNLSSVDIHKLVVRGFYAGVVDQNTKNKAIIAVDYQDKGMDESLVPYPVKWAVGAGAKEAGYLNYTTDSWAATNSIEAIQGLGTISYIPACTNPIDFLLPWTPEMEDLADKDGKLVSKGNLVDNGNKKFARDINGSDIRIVGTWPGDFWLFTGTGAIKAGSKVQIKFESRVSGTNHMFWQVEYYDGGNWKIAGDYQETDVTGTKITYTHSMNPDASTNVKVNPIVTFNHNNDHCYFRFRCMANWQTNGNGPLAARNGGTGRISVNDVTEAGVEWWPSITIIEEGDGVDRPDTDPVMANIITTPDYLTFEGTPEGPKTISISSDYDFTVSATADWLSLDVNQGVKGEKTAVKVTCEPSSSSKLREAALVIVSADSKKTVPVIQSAAGQELDGFISLGTNYADVSFRESEIAVDVQSNVEFTVESDVDWITPVPSQAAMVDKTTLRFHIAKNEDQSSARVGHITFANQTLRIESVLTVSQEQGQPDNPNLVLFEDFEWMKAYFPQYEAATGKKVGDTIGKKSAGENSPQIYTAEFPDEFRQEFVERGWTDLNPGAQLVYINDAYLKLSRTGGNNTAVQLSLSKYLHETSDLSLSFKYAMQIQGSGNVDAGPIAVLIDGDGTFTNGTKVSELFTSAQEKGELFWNEANTSIVGASPETKLTFINYRVLNEDGSFNWSVSGAGRFFLDDISIEKSVPKEPLNAVWTFSAETMDEYKDLFGGASGVVSQEPGFGVLANGDYFHVPSTTSPGGAIYYYQVDKTSYTPSKDSPKRVIGSTGDPFINGGWPGDYWLFTASDGDAYPAGTKLEICFLTRVSATGHKYAMAEYWDGEAWQPAFEVKTETETGTNAQYNFVQDKANQELKATWTLVAPCTEMQFRLTTTANWQQNGKGALENPNGGTCRIAERCSFRVVTE